LDPYKRQEKRLVLLLAVVAVIMLASLLGKLFR
jgi:hypothetical protein